MLSSINDDKKLTIISSTAHNLHQLTKVAGTKGAFVDKIFDLVVLDESSQIPVTLALKPLGAMTSAGQLIIAGDHKQMPPIQRLQPPEGAEHLVGSIQEYLVRRFDVKPVPLLLNYRSNADLVEYAKTLGYPAELKAAFPIKDLQLVQPIETVSASLPNGLPVSSAYVELLRPDRRVTALVHDDPTSSQANEIEAGLVAGLAYVA
jgi:superfamily I DNA and/or RNA helicase